MSLSALLKQPLSVQHFAPTGAHDDYGNEIVAQVGSPTTVNGYLEQTEEREITLNRETYITDWLAILPAGTVIDGNDRITFGGATYEVIGPPDRKWNPRLGAESHVEAHLRVVTG
jgi:hypothetical protein